MATRRSQGGYRVGFLDDHGRKIPKPLQMFFGIALTNNYFQPFQPFRNPYFGYNEYIDMVSSHHSCTQFI